MTFILREKKSPSLRRNSCPKKIFHVIQTIYWSTLWDETESQIVMVVDEVRLEGVNWISLFFFP